MTRLVVLLWWSLVSWRVVSVAASSEASVRLAGTLGEPSTASLVTQQEGGNAAHTSAVNVTEPEVGSGHHAPTNKQEQKKVCTNGICRDPDAPVRRHHKRQGSALYHSCVDVRFDYCATEAANGTACTTQPLYAHAHCPQTCGTCHNRTRLVSLEESFDPVERREIVLDDGEEASALLSAAQASHIHNVAGADLGVPQALPDGDKAEQAAILQQLEEARSYVRDVVQVEPFYEPVRHICQNQEEQCAVWALEGECEESWDYMCQHCAPVCQCCEELSTATKCPIDPHAYNAWSQPGDLHNMFVRITTDEAFQRYHPQILSRPSDDEEEDGPWVVVLDDFLTAAEADRMIQLGQALGYERSTDVGELLEDGTNAPKTNEGRTSTNAWCNEEPCVHDAVTLSLQERIARLTQIPTNHSEAFQMLRYETGQFYEEHHDYIDDDFDRAEGVRILTVFLYLNDDNLQGGGTHFPGLDLTVEPQRGRALLWPSVLNDAPHFRDPRTNHEALGVTQGTKYAVNAWFHQRDFQTPRAMGC